ncbi:Hypothetical predicted protein [Mytilus galloprovincialis]|uniref:B box-type domain-containing protein n=1 Tax=Mytilus galloprovincialis TaxID=29158 RepID=A0A8B6GZ95_MYTGA|nr:Hypothetical predicted protein [Mytilus galloprovincialis]
MPVHRCYECSNVLCNECRINHDKLTDTEYHTFQSTNDKILLNNKFEVSNKISDMKALPGGLLVIALDYSNKLLIYSVSDKQQNEIKVRGMTRSIAILDRDTVVVLLTRPNTIAIVDIRKRRVIPHVDLRLLLPPYLYIPMFYTDDQFYISSLSGITVTDMSGTKDREIDLGFKQTDMCYDTKAARIYCIDPTGGRLICIDRSGNTIFTFTDTGLSNAHRLTIDNEGYVLILCHGNYSEQNFTVYRISPDGKSGEVIITGKLNESKRMRLSSICIQEQSDEVVIGKEETVYTYKKKREN